MKRCYVEKRDGEHNFPATHFIEKDDFFYVYNDQELVAVFDKGVVTAIVLSESQDTRRGDLAAWKSKNSGKQG